MNYEANFYAIIPANVRYDKGLSSSAKLLYGEITALCSARGYCWANNAYFADLYGVSARSITRWLGDLVNLGYIKLKSIMQNNQLIERRIYISENTDKSVMRDRRKCREGMDKNVRTPRQKRPNPIDKNGEDNNTKSNNTKINTGERNTMRARTRKCVLKSASTKKFVQQLNVKQQEQFDELWSMYPNKQGKSKALEHFQRAMNNGVEFDEILNGLRNYIFYIEQKGIEQRYIKHGATWLSQQCWLDDYTIYDRKTNVCKETLGEHNNRVIAEFLAKFPDSGGEIHDETGNCRLPQADVGQLWQIA